MSDYFYSLDFLFARATLDVPAPLMCAAAAGYFCVIAGIAAEENQ